MITTRDQLRPVLEYHAVGRLHGRPVGANRRRHVAAVEALARRPLDLVAGTDFLERLRAPVRHQDRGVTPYAVDTGMTASSIRVDRPLERHLRLLRHAVQG